MQWNDDMSVAPAGEEWVMGAIELDESDPVSYVYESVIFDAGHWMNSMGIVVDPVAWCRIDKYVPINASREWESHPAFAAAFESIDDMMPVGVSCIGIAVANHETGEGALILDNCHKDLESAIFDADVKQDILGDAQRQYSESVEFLNSSFSTLRKH